jgi:hypothetical protein
MVSAHPATAWAAQEKFEARARHPMFARGFPDEKHADRRGNTPPIPIAAVAKHDAASGTLDPAIAGRPRAARGRRSLVWFCAFENWLRQTRHLQIAAR